MKFRPTHLRRAASAFTMIEIALCLAIIGLALVAIVGVIPIGLNTQRDTREETVVNQDATVLLEAIRNGVRGQDDLTNYVYAITNYASLYNTNTHSFPSVPTYTYAYTYSSATKGGSQIGGALTNGANIIGLLSTPEYVDTNYNAAVNLLGGGYSNHVVAYVRSLSGLAAEKPPQNNAIMVGDMFSYRLLVVNAPLATDTNIFGIPAGQPNFNKQIAANQRELRLTFFWPIRPNGSVGNSRQTFRATIAGQLSHLAANGVDLYYYQSQSFKQQP